MHSSTFCWYHPSESSSSCSGSESDFEKSEKSVKSINESGEDTNIKEKNDNEETAYYHDISKFKQRKSDSSREWEENPKMYGIRRSGRARKEPDRLLIKNQQANVESQGQLVRKR